MNKIGFIGDGWGAVSAVSSLLCSFEIECFTADNDVLSLLSENDRSCNSIDDINSQTIVCSGFKPIIDLTLLEKKTFINIHYSLLPKYRGLHSTVWAILNDELEIGLSIHLMNRFIDDGDIIYQKKWKNDGITSASEYIKLFNDHIENNLSSIISDFESGKIIPKKQNKKNATWVGKRNIDDCKINFNQSVNEIKNLFRVLKDPYPLPFFTLKGKKIKVHSLKMHYANCNTHLGRILNIDDEGLWVKVQDGYVILNNLCDESGQKIDLKEIKIGMYLNEN